MVNTAVPLADIIAPPAAGLLADKLGNFRIFMVAITFINGASSLLLLTIDSLPKQNVATNLTYSMELCCVLKPVTNESFCFESDGLMTLPQSNNSASLYCVQVKLIL